MNTMKNIINIATVLALLLTAVPGTGLAIAQDEGPEAAITTQGSDSINRNEDAVSNAQASYLQSLQAAQRSTVEKAIFNVVVLKLQHPELEVEEINTELKRLALNSNSRSVRYKAYIAINFLSDARWVKSHRNELKVLAENEQDKLFSKLADEIRQDYMTSADEMEK